jgi:hypothetical protein
MPSVARWSIRLELCCLGDGFTRGALIMIALGLFAVHTNPRAQLQVL